MAKTCKDSEFISYVEERLEHWANWHASGNYYGLGYNSESIAYVLMTVGVMIKSTAPKPLPCDEEAEEIESLIMEMTKQNEKMAFILRHHYFASGALRAKAESFSAEYSVISWKKFKDYVDMAKQWLAGRLSVSKSKPYS